jgi:hypothetical protein
MMKHLFLFFFAMFFLNAHAQSNLPACASPPFNNCYGEWKFENGNRYSGEWANNKKMVKERSFFLMGINTLGNSGMINTMVTEYILGLMAKNTQGNGQTIKEMVKEQPVILMGKNI